MKIEINRIPPEGLYLEEKLKSKDLDLDTELIKFVEPISISAKAFKITNVVTVEVFLESKIQSICSRCINEFIKELKKEIRFNYKIEPNQTYIEIDSDIREEIILDYPIKPLCRQDCKGLCQYCGQELNKGECSCNK